MKSSRIIIGEGLGNTRDLGGLVGAGGKKIACKRLIRSGTLSDIDDKTAKMLTRDYSVHTVIDLRMDMEIDDAPDKELDGVKTVFLPLLDSSYFGIARDEYSVEAWLNVFKNNPKENPKKIFREMYLKIAFEDRSVPLFREFFDTLLANEKGAVLWHCSAGKDRVGISTALLLGALGVSRKDIVNDYYLTEQLTRKEILRIAFLAPLKGYTGNIHRALIIIFCAKKEYIGWVLDEIDARYGSIYRFLVDRIGLTDAEIKKLQKMYLE